MDRNENLLTQLLWKIMYVRNVIYTKFSQQIFFFFFRWMVEILLI